MQQRTDEWFRARLGKATGSRFNDIMTKTRSGDPGAARKNYLAELVIERLTGQRVEMFTTAAMQWGIDNEPLAKLAFTAETGLDVEEAPFVQHAVLEAGVSPDGYVEDGLIEIKCPNTATHLETLHSMRVPRQYVAQVQGQMWITDKQQCYFVSFDPRLPSNAQLFITLVERDPNFIKNLEDEVIKFLEEVDQELEFVRRYEL